MASSRYSTKSFRAGGTGDDGYVPMNELLDPETLYTKQNQIGTFFPLLSFVEFGEQGADQGSAG